MAEEKKEEKAGPGRPTARELLAWAYPAHQVHTITWQYPRKGKEFVLECSCDERLIVTDHSLISAKSSPKWAQLALRNVPFKSVNQ